MKNYYRLMLGRGSAFAEECFSGGYIGTNMGIPDDLTGKLPDDMREFNKVYVQRWLEPRPEKSKVAAGLACGTLWNVCKGMSKGDIVLCPDGNGNYRVAEIAGNYYYVGDTNLPHRRNVKWLATEIRKEDISDTLKNSAGSIGTLSGITKHADEIEKLINAERVPDVVATDTTIEDPITFALEKHLEDFLVRNWSGTDLSHEFEIFEDEGEQVGQQYPSDTGPIDILAVSKDRKTLLVVELKRGRASDVVVGQILRYMGYVKEQLAEADQNVRGVIIALEDDLRLRRALAMTDAVEFYRYEVSFKLVKS